MPKKLTAPAQRLQDAMAANARTRGRRAKALTALRAIAADHRKWLLAGLPKRTPITKAEVERRIDLFEEAVALIRLGLP